MATAAYTQSQIDAEVSAASAKYGVPAAVLYAVAQTESGLNPSEPGGGMYQDIPGGEASNAAFGGNPQNVYNLNDSVINAAETIAAAKKANPGADWGTVAASAQKPLNPTNYASVVNSYLQEPISELETPHAPTPATLMAADTTPKTPPANAPLAPPIAGANVKNFHGYDLSTIPPNDLGNAEKAIEAFVTNPNATDANGLTLNQRLSQDFGYTTSYIDKLPANQQSQVKATLIWASQYLDNSSAASKAQFNAAISGTEWYKSTTQFQRAWQNIQGTDPATAAKYLTVAQDKVLGVANQIGVKLSHQQLSQIANMYAAQTFTPTGTYSAMSGTSPEWLDQAVISAVTNAGKGGPTSDLTQQGTTATSGGSLTGIASSLYESFQQAAQSYLMYNPADPTKSLMSQNDLMTQVNKALQDYTGTGATGQISQFEAGALNQFTEQLKTQASSLYPSLAGAIAQGTAPADYVKPMQTTIANTLGLDPASVDFTSPTWNWAIATPDPKTGVKTALTLDQVQQKITSPNFTFQGPNGQALTYDNTNQAMQTANGLTNSLSSLFGVGGK